VPDWRTPIVCHYCQREVLLISDEPRQVLHLDGSEVCSQGSVVRWLETKIDWSKHE
jgi:hypothetical protein